MRDRNRNHDDEGEVTRWSAFVAGALIGAGVALLFAPQTGPELRGRLRDYADRAKDDLLEKAEETWDAAVERGKEYYYNGEEVLRDVGESAKDYAREGQERMKDVSRSAQEFAKQTQHMVREPGRSAL